MPQGPESITISYLDAGLCKMLSVITEDEGPESTAPGEPVGKMDKLRRNFSAYSVGQAPPYRFK
jgi:hypothetical protein